MYAYTYPINARIMDHNKVFAEVMFTLLVISCGQPKITLCLKETPNKRIYDAEICDIIFEIF